METMEIKSKNTMVNFVMESPRLHTGQINRLFVPYDNIRTVKKQGYPFSKAFDYVTMTDKKNHVKAQFVAYSVKNTEYFSHRTICAALNGRTA